MTARDAGELTPAQDFPGEDGKTRQEKNSGASLPEKNPTEGARYRANAERASKQGGRVLVRGARQGRSNVENDMARVRVGIRQPVTSLWQMETERAMTAPTRRPLSAGSYGTHNADCKLSQRRPHSHIGQSRGGRVRPSATTVAGNGAGNNETLGVRGGGAVVTADRCSKGEDKGRMLKDDGNSARLTPLRGLEERMGNGEYLGGRVPMPLRSSHRVGPVGDLGERGRFYCVWEIL